MKKSKTFGLRLKALRKSCNLTQYELATRVDRSIEAISALERGVSFPSYETLERLSEVMNIPIREFFEPQGLETDDPKRAALMARMTSVLRKLSNSDLELAISQIEVILSHVERR